jgi:hypothetical protein
MCWATNGQLLTNKVLSRWKEYFEQNLNESSEEEPHTNQEPPRENDVIIDLPRRDEIVEAIKYLKDNKTAGSARTRKRPSCSKKSAECTQRDDPAALDRWNTIPESLTEGVLCPVYKKGGKFDCKSYCDICVLNVAFKIFAKILHIRLLPYANAVIEHYKSRVPVRQINNRPAVRSETDSGKKQRIHHHNSPSLNRLQVSIRNHNKNWNLCNNGGVRFPYQKLTYLNTKQRWQLSSAASKYRTTYYQRCFSISYLKR